MQELKKGYGGFILLTLLMIALMFVPALVPGFQAKGAALFIFNEMNIYMAALTYLICRNQRIYWYTGVTYEDAEAAGEERRIKYAKKHFKRFGIYALLFVAYTLLSWLLDFPIAADITLGTLGVCAVAISTVKFEL